MIEALEAQGYIVSKDSYIKRVREALDQGVIDLLKDDKSAAAFQAGIRWYRIRKDEDTGDAGDGDSWEKILEDAARARDEGGAIPDMSDEDDDATDG